jgi:hypothetical protein
MSIKSDNQNLILILGRYHTTQDDDTPLEEISFIDIRPVLMIAAHRAEVIIIMDGNEFVVLKHRHMNIAGQVYHKSSLTNIISAR